jgi:hypothetical protein
LQDNCKKINGSWPVLSAYHTKYFAYELTRRCPPDSIEKLAGALVDAQVRAFGCGVLAARPFHRAGFCLCDYRQSDA